MSMAEGMGSRKMRFDGTINLGHIATVVAMVIGGFMAFSALRESNATLAQRVAAIEQASVAAQNMRPDVAVLQSQMLAVQGFIAQTTSTIQRIDERLNTIQVDLSAIRSQGGG